MKYAFCVFLAVLVAAFSVEGFAAPTEWKIEDGGNGHWYDVVHFVGTWGQANAHAQTQYYNQAQGHLVTLTSASEKEFVYNNFKYNRYFLGGYQTDNTSEPSGRWAWVTGEPWSYTNWHPNEPNDGVGYPTGHEDYLEFKGITTTGEWNDIAGDVIENGYIIEYEPTAPPSDTDGDGVSDSEDNCPTVPNPDQADINDNEIGDACDFAYLNQKIVDLESQLSTLESQLGTIQSQLNTLTQQFSDHTHSYYRMKASQHAMESANTGLPE